MDKLTSDSYQLGYSAGTGSAESEHLSEYNEDNLTLVAEAHFRQSVAQSWVIQRVFVIGFLDACCDWCLDHQLDTVQ